MPSSPAAYAVDIPGLSEAVSGATPPPTSQGKHTSLLEAIRCHTELDNSVLATQRGDAWLSRRKVLTATGELVHDDHEAWLKTECAQEGGDVRATWRRLRELDHQLSECTLTTLYIVADRGGARADDFVQLVIFLEDEHIERRLFDPQRCYAPEDMAELIRVAEDGPQMKPEERRRLRAPAYRLREAVDVARFVDEAQQLDAKTRTAQGRRWVTLTADGQEPRTMTVDELNRELDPKADQLFRWKGRRLFDDWALSSAGRSGARLCNHWALDLTDWTDPRSGERTMSLTPLWTYTRPLAEVDRPRLSDYALYAKLETLDRRVKVPFAWFFYMLHGNRVHDWAARRVLEAAEAGTIVLPEHDYRVLKAWEERPYGF